MIKYIVTAVLVALCVWRYVGVIRKDSYEDCSEKIDKFSKELKNNFYYCAGYIEFNIYEASEICDFRGLEGSEMMELNKTHYDILELCSKNKYVANVEGFEELERDLRIKYHVDSHIMLKQFLRGSKIVTRIEYRKKGE